LAAGALPVTVEMRHGLAGEQLRQLTRGPCPIRHGQRTPAIHDSYEVSAGKWNFADPAKFLVHPAHTLSMGDRCTSVR
jgi:hypothetical protein